MASDIELVIQHSKQLEQTLESRLDATGKGLHEKATSIATQLDQALLRQLRWIATMRNKVVHENFSLPSQADFERSCQQALQQLQQIAPSPTLSLQSTGNQSSRSGRPTATARTSPRQQSGRRSSNQHHRGQSKSGQRQASWLWPALIVLALLGFYLMSSGRI